MKKLLEEAAIRSKMLSESEADDLIEEHEKHNYSLAKRAADHRHAAYDCDDVDDADAHNSRAEELESQAKQHSNMIDLLHKNKHNKTLPEGIREKSKEMIKQSTRELNKSNKLEDRADIHSKPNGYDTLYQSTRVDERTSIVKPHHKESVEALHPSLRLSTGKVRH